MPRFSLVDLLLTMFGCALIANWSQTPWPEEPKFNTWVFFYSKPEVPDQYRSDTQLIKKIYRGIFLDRNYKSGADFYLRSHKREWERVCFHFALGHEYWDDDFSVRPRPDQLANDSWTSDHELHARCQGRDTAIEQIIKLIGRYGESKLRDVANTRPWYLPLIEIRWNLVCSLLFVFCCLLRLYRVFSLRTSSKNCEMNR